MLKPGFISSFSIAAKLRLLMLASVFGVIALAALFLASEKKLVMEERQNSVRQTVEIAHGVLRHYYELASKGALSESEAKQAAITSIKALRYNANDYFWINDMSPRMVMHPSTPALDGTDLSENKDPTGKRLFVEFVNVVKAEGAGFVFYMWPKPGSEQPEQKISYVKGFPEWGWIVGSGVYIDTINDAIFSEFVKLGIGALALALILVVISAIIARSITEPIGRATEAARQLASGDLTTVLISDRHDEIGRLMQAVNGISQGLANVVWQVRSATDTIATASSEIASGNLDLSSRTEEQASSLEETASSMEELTSTVKQNADNARQANQLAVSASQVAVKGGNVVAQVVDTMEDINTSSRKIVDIISVIDGIAFQTNILALNAAVEAARAGEQGRGFAVVASEVRSLAQRSAAAAKEIKGLIDDSVEKVDTGSKLVAQAGTTMEEIVDSVRRVTDIMAEIMAASQEQSSGIEQVNQAIGQMDQVTQQNAALVEEAAAAAESLQGQTTELTGLVGIFKLKAVNHGTTEEAIEMVEKAVEHLHVCGREQTFTEVNNKLGQFCDRDLYVVVYDLNGKNLAHGANPKLIGKDLIEAKDADGKPFMKERVSIATNAGKGWQDYKFQNPMSHQIEPKSMYLEKFEDLIVGCGIYKT